MEARTAERAAQLAPAATPELGAGETAEGNGGPVQAEAVPVPRAAPRAAAGTAGPAPGTSGGEQL
jgi:hypothetical protein